MPFTGIFAVAYTKGDLFYGFSLPRAALMRSLNVDPGAKGLDDLSVVNNYMISLRRALGRRRNGSHQEYLGQLQAQVKSCAREGGLNVQCASREIPRDPRSAESAGAARAAAQDLSAGAAARPSNPGRKRHANFPVCCRPGTAINRFLTGKELR